METPQFVYHFVHSGKQSFAPCTMQKMNKILLEENYWQYLNKRFSDRTVFKISLISDISNKKKTFKKEKAIKI